MYSINVGSVYFTPAASTGGSRRAPARSKGLKQSLVYAMEQPPAQCNEKGETVSVTFQACAVLEQVHPDPQNRKGFRAAAAGLVVQIACGEEDIEVLPWLLQVLTGSAISGIKGLKAAARRIADHFGNEKHKIRPEELQD